MQDLCIYFPIKDKAFWAFRRKQTCSFQVLNKRKHKWFVVFYIVFKNPKLCHLYGQIIIIETKDKVQGMSL